MHDQVDVMGLRVRSETHGVYLIMQWSLGRAVPHSGRTQPPHARDFPVVPPGRVDRAGGDVAGLAALPNPVVALTAVPVLGARPLPTRPSLPGARGLAVVPFPRRRVTTG